MRRITGIALGVIALLIASTAFTCGERRDPAPGGNALDVPGGSNDDAQLAPECHSEALLPHCDEIGVLAEQRFIHEMPEAKKMQQSKVIVLADGRLRYVARLRISGNPAAFIVKEYSFIFARWQSVEQRRDLLVFSKTIDVTDYEARIRLEKGAPTEGKLVYFVDAVLETVSPVV